MSRLSRKPLLSLAAFGLLGPASSPAVAQIYCSRARRRSPAQCGRPAERPGDQWQGPDLLPADPPAQLVNDLNSFFLSIQP